LALPSISPVFLERAVKLTRDLTLCHYVIRTQTLKIAAMAYFFVIREEVISMKKFPMPLCAIQQLKSGWHFQILNLDLLFAVLISGCASIHYGLSTSMFSNSSRSRT
jgi:hypothetical protein